ncbi:MAG: pilus assembly PilX N-terminal domain-containing protein [Actinomycetota bacterium]|nr:pilus assembly PilX N-terminal domain-containing protein [Actinomycetota bacterium]
MRKRVLQRLRSEAGVAMVTVLFVGSALSVLASVAAFTTIEELRAGRDDRKASEALAYAEAGIDRLILELRTGKLTWGDIREAGCATAPLTLTDGNVGNGSYSVQLTVFDPSAPLAQQLPPSPWVKETNDAQRPCTQANGTNRPTSPRSNQWFAVTAVGSHPTAKRAVLQGLQIGLLGLPIGIYADTINANGNVTMDGVSLLTPGDVTGREKIAFKNTDPYHTLNDFWPGQDSATNVPAAAHAVGTIYLKKTGGLAAQEHVANSQHLNCTANGIGGAEGQSQWDQSGPGGAIPGGLSPSNCSGIWAGTPAGPPPTSDFTAADLTRVSPQPALSDQDYMTLRDSAKQTGLYCFIASSGTKTCTAKGQTWTFGGTVGATDLTGLPRNFVAYFEYESPTGAFTSNLIHWNGANVWPCSTTASENKSAVIVVRNGSLQMEGDTQVNGAAFIPEGAFDVQGKLLFNGTIIAREFRNLGSATFSMTDCWIGNMPGPFLKVSPALWRELDR